MCLSEKLLNLKAMKHFVLGFFLLLVCCSKLTAQPAAIGQWREHMDYRSGKRVALADDTVYVATNFGAYSVGREDGEISRLSKVTGLNDVGVRTLGYDAAG